MYYSVMKVSSPQWCHTEYYFKINPVLVLLQNVYKIAKMTQIKIRLEDFISTEKYSVFQDVTCNKEFVGKCLWRHSNQPRTELHGNEGKTCLRRRICTGKLDKRSIQDGKCAHELAWPFPVVVLSWSNVNKFQWHQIACNEKKKALDWELKDF